MIKIKAYNYRHSGEGFEEYIDFEISKFPDGTSQSWKLSNITALTNAEAVDVYFNWENNETEIFHLFMLLDLIKANNKFGELNLHMAYLPYARQDKEISNGTTFALHTFAKMLNTFNLNGVFSFDAHSKVARKLIKNFVSLSADKFHSWVLEQYKPDVLFYPDMGAFQRYAMAENEIALFGHKERDQATGKIIKYEVVNAGRFPLQDKRVLIVDDLCDAGGTFIMAANTLKEYRVADIALCISHGLFSKGFDEMKAAGISKFYTTNSLQKNVNEFKVY